ncbi:MAG TPA: lytic transglycosylase F, partial [Bacteroidales bacterium]|nr:lytic transglycosylase F [Bacteroidales bacterium]
YNLGMAHFYDAFELAKKHGKSPITYAVVIECLKCKSKPLYYNDPVVKFGYLNPWYVERFVREIYARYNAYCAVFPEK